MKHKLNLHIQIDKIFVSGAKERINEGMKHVKVSFIRKNVLDQSQIEIQSSDIKRLTDNVICFNPDIKDIHTVEIPELIFPNIDRDNDLLEVSLILFGKAIVKNFKPICKMIKSLKSNRIVEEECQPNANSFIRFKYLITSDNKSFRKVIDIDNPPLLRKLLSSSCDARIIHTTPIVSQHKRSCHFRCEIKRIDAFGDYTVHTPNTSSKGSSGEDLIIVDNSTCETKKKVEDNPNVTIQTQKKFTTTKEEALNCNLGSKNDREIFKDEPEDLLLFPEAVETDFKKIGENVCEGFFLSGVSSNVKATIQHSESFKACCNHSECSLLPAIRPDVVFRFPAKDSSQFEISNNTSSLCFPSGIKICFEKDETKIKPKENFMTVMTNVNGDRLYIYNYFFYLKIDTTVFYKKFHVDPIKTYINNKILTVSEECKKNPSEIPKKLQKHLDFTTKLINNTYVYLPYCISLISYFPNAEALEKCLEVILKILTATNQTGKMKNIEGILKHLVYEVPSPPYNSTIQFYLPYLTFPIEMKGTVYKSLPAYNTSLSIILDYFSIDNIILIHYLMLVEQRILFTCDDPQLLFSITDAFITLLYPIKWLNTYIPILTEDMVKYLQSFMPFIMGIESGLLQHARRAIENEIYLVNIAKNTVELFSSKVKAKVDGKILKSYPKFSHDHIKRNLTLIQKSRKKLGKVDEAIQGVFIQSMVYMFGDYRKYTSYVKNIPLFNYNCFILNKDTKYSSFYNEAAMSQNFRQFLQISNKFEFKYFNDICNQFKELINRPVLQRFNSSEGYLITEIKSSRSQTVGSKRERHSVSVRFDSNDRIERYDTESCPFELNEAEYPTKTFLVYPYFVKDPNFKFDELREFIKKNFVYANEYIHKNKLIKVKFESRIFNFDSIGCLSSDIPIQSINRYRINPKNPKRDPSHKTFPILDKQLIIRRTTPTKENSPESNLKICKAPYKRRCSLINVILNSNQEDTAMYQEQIGDIIRDYMVLLLQSMPIMEIQMTEISSLFMNKFARREFATVVFQDKFRQGEGHCLSERSYKELSQIIFFALLNFQNNPLQYEDVRLITKSTFYYYRIVNDKFYYMYNEVAKNDVPFAMWKEVDFWKCWVEQDLVDMTRAGTSHEEEENIYLHTLVMVAKKMKDLRLEVSFISSCIHEKIGKIYIQDAELYEQLKQEIQALSEKKLRV